MKGLKITLWVCAISFLMGFIAAALPWQVLTSWCNQNGVLITTSEPLIVFLARISLMIFGMIGVFFIILARNPLKYGEMLPLAGYGLLLLGVLILIGSILYILPNALPIITITTLLKVFFYFVLGALILLFRKGAIQVNNA
jgi:hypothetical protein